MFKNHAIQMNVVKKNDGEPEVPTLEIQPESITHVKEATKELMWEGTKLAVIVIAADTARKVIVALVTK